MDSTDITESSPGTGFGFNKYSGEFNGTDEYLSIGSDALNDFDNDEALTLSCWVRTGSETGDRDLMGKQDAVGGVNRGYMVRVNAAGKVIFRLWITCSDSCFSRSLWAYD